MTTNEQENISGGVAEVARARHAVRHAGAVAE